MVSCWMSVCPSARLSICRLSILIFISGQKYQYNFAKLGIGIDIVEIWFRIANRQISLIFDRVYQPATHPYFYFWTITWETINGFSHNLIRTLILRRSGLGWLLMGKFCQFLTVIRLQHGSDSVLPFHIFILVAGKGRG